MVETVLEVARWAPSGANTQPWDVRVVTGATKTRITRALLEAREKGVREHPDYQYYPVEWFEPYKARRMGLGVAMYSTQGARRNRAESWNNNYRFFGAPVGLLFFIHKDLATGSWMDYGMFIQNVMLAARRFSPRVGVFRGNCSMNGQTIAHASLAIAKAKLDKYVGVPW